MPELSEQQREAMKAARDKAVERFSANARHPDDETEQGFLVDSVPPEDVYAEGFRDGFAAGLAAAEQPEANELADAVRKVCNEWVSEHGVGPSSDWHVQRLLPLADRVDGVVRSLREFQDEAQRWANRWARIENRPLIEVAEEARDEAIAEVDALREALREAAANLRMASQWVSGDNQVTIANATARAEDSLRAALAAVEGGERA